MHDKRLLEATWVNFEKNFVVGGEQEPIIIYKTKKNH